ncbi:hypothetical protein [Bradyrhizobium sp. Ai1a-2]|uniref:hypothetical protein n=1 Tax=Bradyrhizobium sp. Ai1a-2 TaxID=196490 RepID=UPI00047F423A|nr:hypothetical protein [Bradyrhizobium sp. Ai1a-2]
MAATKPFSSRRENLLKESALSMPIRDQQRSSVMLAYLLNLIYRLALRASLSQMGRHHLGR